MQNEPVSEIDLRECIGVVIRRKTIIAAIVLAAAIPVAVWTFLTPRIYEVSMIIEPPISAITETGVQGWDSVVNIKAKIEAGAYNSSILAGMKPSDEIPQFSVSVPKDTRLIKVSLKMTVDQVELGKEYLAKLMESIDIGYTKIIEDKRNKIDNQIKMVQSHIGTKQNDIKLKNEQFKILESRERQFVEDIKDMRANSERLVSKREAVFERKENSDDVSALFYAATIQQNSISLTQMQDDLSELRSKKENVINAIDNLKSGINESRIEIVDLNLVKGGVQNIQVIQHPLRSARPVGPKRRQNTLFAGFTGLFIGLCAAFLVERWENPPAVG